MKILIVLAAFLGASWALPTAQDGLQFKNVFVNPVIPPPKDVNSRIIGGYEAEPHSIPYQAYLVFRGTAGTWLCSGSLISSYYILTAAHCLTDALTVTVYLGAHNVAEYEVTQLRVSTNQFIQHEDYSATDIRNDIGLVKLLAAVEFNEYINVARLPSPWDETDYEGQRARLSGWGITSGSGETSLVLLEAYSVIMNNVVCNSYYQIVQDSQVCTAGTGGIGTCNGDSGGPLAVNDTLIGLTSYGATDCPAGYPSVYTRVTSYLQWIDEHVSIQQSTTPSSTVEHSTTENSSTTEYNSTTVQQSTTGQQSTAVHSSSTVPETSSVQQSTTEQQSPPEHPSTTVPQTSPVQDSTTGQQSPPVHPSTTAPQTSPVQQSTTGQQSPPVHPSTTVQQTTSVQQSTTGQPSTLYTRV